MSHSYDSGYSGDAGRRLRCTYCNGRKTMFLQQLINALTIGSLYALTAMGATLIYGILGILDI